MKIKNLVLTYLGIGAAMSIERAAELLRIIELNGNNYWKTNSMYEERYYWFRTVLVWPKYVPEFIKYGVKIK